MEQKVSKKTKQKVATQKRFVWVRKSGKKEKGFRQLSFDDYMKQQLQHLRG